MSSSDGRRGSVAEFLKVDLRQSHWIRIWEKALAENTLPSFDSKRTFPGLLDLIIEPDYLLSLLGIRSKADCKVLVPGCGSGYAVKTFLKEGFNAYGIDISPIAVDRANLLLKNESIKCQAVDFFTDEDPDILRGVNVVFDYNFLPCFGSIEAQKVWSRQMHSLLYDTNGVLVVVFPFQVNGEINNKLRGSPPYRIDPLTIRVLMEQAGFTTLKLHLVDDEYSFKCRKDWEILGVFKRGPVPKGFIGRIEYGDNSVSPNRSSDRTEL